MRAASIVLAALLAPFLILLSPAPVNAAGCPAPGGAVVPSASATGEVVFTGHGWGPQMGLSQYGAQGAALLGCTYDQILAGYFADSKVVTETMPDIVNLSMLDNGTEVEVKAETAGVTWSLSNCAATGNCPPAQPVGSTWRLALNVPKSGYVLWDTALPPHSYIWAGGNPTDKMTLSHPGEVVRMTTRKGTAIHLDRQLKWDYSTFSIDGTELDVVQSIVTSPAGTAMDKYLWGIDVIPAIFPTEALKAQAVVSRSYAATRTLLLNPADQRYLGYAQESAGAGGTNGRLWKAAVDATSGAVIKSTAGAYFETRYASSFGGQSEDRRFVLGGPAVPQLQAVDDSRWEMASNNWPQNRSWAQAFTKAQIAQAFGLDVLSSIVTPAHGQAARLDGVRITGMKAGVAVEVSMPAWSVKEALGLQSAGFDVTVAALAGPTQPVAVPPVGGLGGPGATAVTGDWNGDGRTDLGWFRDGTWALRNADGSVLTLRFGGAGDLPVVGDWNGDGKDTVGVFQGGHWSLRNSNTSGVAGIRFRFGAPGDQPVVGDWNGNRKDGIGIYRGGGWYLRNALSSGLSRYRFHFGRPGDIAVAGDWNRNRLDGVGVYREGRWYLRNALRTGPARYSLAYGGLAGDRPVTGTWARGRADTIGVVRGTDWFLRGSLYAGGSRSRVSFAG